MFITFIPEWFVTYGNQLYFDPALPESRKHICMVITDIVSRYDVDAIHMDDYFYPYPNPGEDFPDHVSFCAIWSQDTVISRLAP